LMYWARKTKLEKEIAASIDPTKGMVETAEMKGEIHRMELRLKQLQKIQADYVTSMTQALNRRQDINTRGKLATRPKVTVQPSRGGMASRNANKRGPLLNVQQAKAEVSNRQEALDGEIDRLREIETQLSDSISAQQRSEGDIEELTQ
ncbi:hypothetical protein KIPB_013174, partial [Kipferlia bialata]